VIPLLYLLHRNGEYSLYCSFIDGVAHLPCSISYSSGSRECTTNIYDPSLQYPLGLIGPATFIWRTPTSDDTNRSLLVRTHPTIARSVVAVFEKANTSNSTVTVTKYEEEFDTFEVTGRRAAEVVKAVLKPVNGSNKETKDVSSGLSRFSCERILTTIQQAWRKLDSQAGPGSVPEGMIFGFEVYDPRLS
jgi:ribonuclease P/MRP protein subunit POP1